MKPCWSWPPGALPFWHRCCMTLTWLLAEFPPRKYMAIQVGVRPHQYSLLRSNLRHRAYCHMSMLNVKSGVHLVSQGHQLGASKSMTGCAKAS